MKSLTRIAALLLLALGASASPAFSQSAQLHIICNASTDAFCNPTTNVGTGTSGDKFWQFGGKAEVNFTTLFSALGITNGNSGLTPHEVIGTGGSGVLGLETLGLPDLPSNVALGAGPFTALDCLNAQVSTATNQVTITDSGAPCGSGGGGGVSIQTNGVLNALQSTLNLQNSALTGGLTVTFANPSAGNVQAGLSGWPALVNGDCLTNNGSVLSWGACGALTMQTNGVNNTSQSSLNLQNSASFNGLTFTFTNTSSGNVQAGFSGSLGLGGLASIPANTVYCNPTSGATGPTTCTLGSGLAFSNGALTPVYSINAQTGTSYPIAASDGGKLVTFKNASPVAVTLPQATTTGFGAGFSVDVENLGTGTVTVTPTSSTINGGASIALATNTGCSITSDGTNYQVSACTAIFSTSGITLQTNGSNNASQTLFNLENATASGGLQITYANPSTGNVQPTLTGWPASLVNGDCLTNNGTTLSWGACGSGGGASNFQPFTASGTWTKPGSGNTTKVVCTGAGGGGGSGALEASGTAAGGGGAGGGGATVMEIFQTSALPSTVTVTIGAGGGGGAAKSVAGNGNTGTGGGQTSFGSYLTAYNGTGGTGGQSGTNAPGGLGGSILGTGSPCGGTATAINAGCAEGGGGGGNGPANMGVGTSGGNSLIGGAGGGAGGGITTGVVAAAGGNGGASSGLTAPSGGGATGVAGTAGSNNTAVAGGSGGGGGGASTTGNGGAGGAGGIGAGGGGGGGALTANSSGAGGPGGNGYCAVVTW